MAGELMIAQYGAGLAAGKLVLDNRFLATTRDRIGMSKRHMASLLGVTVVVLNSWETRTVTPRGASLIRIDAVVRDIWDAITAAEDSGISWVETVPLSQATMLYGAPAAQVLSWCEGHDITCHDLGVLGTWVTVGKEDAARCREIREAMATRKKEKDQ